jgi:DNA-binding transcriptional LysR family regulator
MLSVSNLLSLPALVAQSDMIATIPKRLALHFLPMLPIAMHPLPFEADSVPVSMFYHKVKQDDQAHSWLRQQLKNHATNIL